jgi:lipopolysaccharide transport system ATP-binding protein
MKDVAIRVDGLGKRYRLSGPRASYETIREHLARAIAAPLRAMRGDKRSDDGRIFWALRDVSFEVKQGEVVGIIGRNGAGKSTLLKLLSRITEPTEGEVDLYGRVGSLLEVGTGFHNELTGRENVFLNGAILGMKRAEIARKFDEIVAFAEVEKFIDTPVKHYSSGMYMRLAFAVAAHLEPEILIVDEVLAVGDAAFQKKCLGKMGDVAREGRTVLFVSHNMAALSHLCRSSLLLESGHLVFRGEVREGVDRYMRNMDERQSSPDRPPHVVYAAGARDESRFAAEQGYITSVAFLNSDGTPKPLVRTWDTVTIRVSYHVTRATADLQVILLFATCQGTMIAKLTTSTHLPHAWIAAGTGHVDCEIPQFPLAAGEYVLGGGLCVPHRALIAYDEQLATITVAAADVFRSGQAPTSPHHLVAFPHRWHLAAGDAFSTSGARYE